VPFYVKTDNEIKRRKKLEMSTLLNFNIILFQTTFKIFSYDIPVFTVNPIIPVFTIQVGIGPQIMSSRISAFKILLSFSNILSQIFFEKNKIRKFF
jgi:hypothetical protein